MTLYLALARTSFRRMLAYRAATLAGLGTNFFFGLLRAAIFVALFRQTAATEVAGYSLRDVITYTGLTQALIAPLMIWGSYDIVLSIRSGQIASDLCKPMDFHAFWLAQDLGRSAYHGLARGLTIMLAYALVFDLSWPSSVAQWLAFALSVLLALLVSFGYRFMINLTAFWTADARGVERIAYLGALLFTGLVIPLAFFPDRLRGIARLSPFAAYMNTPAEVYLGIVTGRAAWFALGVQLFWALLFAVVGRALYRRGVRRLMVQGG